MCCCNVSYIQVLVYLTLLKSEFDHGFRLDQMLKPQTYFKRICGVEKDALIKNNVFLSILGPKNILCLNIL